MLCHLHQQKLTRAAWLASMENLFKLVRGRDQSGDNSNNFHPISVAGGQYRGVDIFQRMGGSQDAQNVCIFHRKHKLKSALRTSQWGKESVFDFQMLQICFNFFKVGGNVLSNQPISKSIDILIKF